MNLFYLSLTLVVLVYSLKLLLQTRTFKNLPPGPFSFPIIGNIHQLKHPFHHTFHGLSQKYGQIFSLWFGSRLVVVVSSYYTVQECFSKNDIVLANRPPFLTGKYTGYNNTTVVLSPYGHHWRNLRRIMMLEIFSKHRLNSFYQMRRDEIMRLVQNLARDSSRYGFTKVELKSRLSEMTFNTIMRMVLGKRYYGEGCDVSDIEEAQEFREIMKELLTIGGINNLGEFVPLVRWFDFDGLEKRVKKISKRTDAFLQGLIDEHRNGKHNANTMIDHLIVQQISQPEYYTDQIIKGLILVMLLAGTETSAITLEWAMSNLLNHPEILKKAKNELETHIKQNCLVEEVDIPKLSYLQNIIYETLRLHPPVPLLLPHMSSEDCTIGEYNIPQNTILLVNVWAIHRDPKMWSNPTQFKPERFEKEGEINKLLSFGLGRRACPGANLGNRTVSLTLALLIQCFEWKRTSKKKIDMVERKGLSLRKKYPLEAMCQVLSTQTNKNIW
ncbi:hypothetical protein VNO78_33203 [Psophocarpus tetragonolobus]|uniref:Cytochrome P450 n=1 Tax=Psophocarpus tetragonolobus TaxID=3891 RepID=A0AAN9RS77_PSOTE